MNEKSVNDANLKYQLVEKIDRFDIEKKESDQSCNVDNDDDDDDNGNEESEEIMIPEFDQVSILAISKVSLRKRSSIHSNVKEKKNDLAENKKSKAFKGFLLNYRGSLLALLAAFIQSLMATLIKKTQLLTSSEATLIRLILAFIIMFTISKYKEIDITGPKEYRSILLLRGFLGMVGLFCSMFALTFIKVKKKF
jgi:hypothetical protein